MAARTKTPQTVRVYVTTGAVSLHAAEEDGLAQEEILTKAGVIVPEHVPAKQLANLIAVGRVRAYDVPVTTEGA